MHRVNTCTSLMANPLGYTETYSIAGFASIGLKYATEQTALGSERLIDKAGALFVFNRNTRSFVSHLSRAARFEIKAHRRRISTTRVKNEGDIRRS